MFEKKIHQISDDFKIFIKKIINETINFVSKNKLMNKLSTNYKILDYSKKVALKLKL
jgi:hypothetical protein